jgi:hypothetical protein
MNQENEKSSGHGRTTWLTLVGLVPLVYVLSVGPVLKVLEGTGRYAASQRFIETFYYPVILLHEYTPLRRPLEKYLELWGVH